MIVYTSSTEMHCRGSEPGAHLRLVSPDGMFLEPHSFRYLAATFSVLPRVVSDAIEYVLVHVELLYCGGVEGGRQQLPPHFTWTIPANHKLARNVSST